LAANKITDVLSKKEQFLYETLREYWIESSEKKQEILSMIVILDLKKLINKSLEKK